MFKKILVLSILFLNISCIAGSGNGSGHGFIFTGTTEGRSANNNVEVLKIGKSCNYNFLGLVASGDASIEEAKKNGGVKNVATVDTTYFSVLSLFTKSCTVVKGN